MNTSATWHILISHYVRYAVGDVCTKFQFTHMADFMARKVIRNALFFGNEKVSSLLVPWATFTEPEVAHVGYVPLSFVCAIVLRVC